MSSSSEIKNLITAQGYNESIIPQLEQHLLAQTSGTPYDFHANRTLLKLYQFYPASSNGDYTTLASLLAILHGSTAQFGALNCLIPENSPAKSDGNDSFASILAMNEAKDACLFDNLWKTLESLEQNSDSVKCVVDAVTSPSALEALRESILETLSVTFKTATLSYVLTCVKIASAEELKGFSVVESVDGDKVVFVDNAENTKRDKGQHTDGTLDYGSVRSLIGRKFDVAVE